MAKITISEIVDSKAWEDFVGGYKGANFLQSWYWGEFHKSLNKQIFRTGFYQGTKLVGVMLSIIETAKRGRYLTVPGGPLIDWENTIQVTLFSKTVKNIAFQNRCVFVRVRPQLRSNVDSKNIFNKLGFRNAPTHLHAELTLQLELDKSKDELLAQMRKTTRYEIRKAQTQALKIDTSATSKDLNAFYKLQVETSKRQGFVPFSLNYLRNQFDVFSKSGNVLLYSVRVNNKLLAQAFIIFYGKEADYHYGASTQLGRKYPGAYLLQWEAIKEAKSRGLERYNFWGVSPIDNINHRFWGVSVFKRGFGGKEVEYLHAQDLIINPLKYKFNYLVEIIRKKTRRI